MTAVVFCVWLTKDWWIAFLKEGLLEIPLNSSSTSCDLWPFFFTRNQAATRRTASRVTPPRTPPTTTNSIVQSIRVQRSDSLEDAQQISRFQQSFLIEKTRPTSGMVRSVYMEIFKIKGQDSSENKFTCYILEIFIQGTQFVVKSMLFVRYHA